VKVISGLGHGCDEEAERLVRLFKFQVPKSPRKLKVKFTKNIKIHFKLKTVPVPKTSVGYSITYSKPQEKISEKESSSYSYSIKINQ
jgi:protein TonB